MSINTQHGPEDLKSFFSGANSDLDKELLGAKDNGEYINGRNQRPISVLGSTGASEKIKGETLLFANSNLSADYVCIGDTTVNEHLVECWVSTVGGEDPAIRIDGEVMVQSANLTFDINFPIQIDINESCAEGEIFLTDFNTVPLIFDLSDIIDSFNSGSQKYFSLFNIGVYQINLSAPLDIPVFIELVDLGGGGGLALGEYQYSLRYVNDAGDRTNAGQKTPPIPVLASTSASSSQYPFVATRGGEPAPTLPTNLGIKIRFRVTNLLDYDSIEIIRLAYNTEAGIGITPQAIIVGRIGVAPGEISIREFIDPAESNIAEIIPDDEEANQLFFIEKAKAIRYFDKRVVLMNYSLASRSMEGTTFTQRNGVEMFPIVEKLGKEGFNDPYHHTYFKHYPSGERYGFSITGWDGVASRGFALGVTNQGNFQFPNRREELAGDSDTFSYNGAATAANIDSVVTKTFEVFDLVDGVFKDDNCTFRSILDSDPDGTSKPSKTNADVTQDCETDPSLDGAIQDLGNQWRAPYNPYDPTSPDDTFTGHNYQTNTFVDPGNSEVDYKPEGFGPNYYSKGVALNGVEDLPSWVKSFTVGRTKRAGRVVAQGIGMYSLIQADFNNAGNAGVGQKEKNKLWFYSADIAEGLVNQSTINDINANPGSYSIQFISPLGFFSELYNFERNLLSDRDLICDLVTYARVLEDAGTINPGEVGIGVDNHVAYNRYRNSDTAGEGFFLGDDGNKSANFTGINSFESKTDGRQSYFEITLESDIYINKSTGGTFNNDFEDSGMKEWTEPFYIVNIVQEGKNVIDQNIDTYLSTGTYIKVESIIGEGDGTPDPSFLLVDERWEDSIPALDSSSTLASNDRFVFLDDGDGTPGRCVNVTFKTPAQVAVIVNDILTNGSHTLVGGEVVTCVYTHTISSDQRTFTIVFDIPGFNIVPIGTKVLIQYNPDTPIRVFGGDHTIGETLFAPIDREATGEDSDDQRDLQFAFDVGFPFRKYFITPRHYVVHDGQDAFNKVQNSRDIFGNREFGRLAYIRQMAIMFASETRVATHYAHAGGEDSNFFPQIHYIIRPNMFGEDEFGNGATAVYLDNNIDARYEDDYGDEFIRWKFGGTRILPQHNTDYSQEGPIEFFSQPDFGFEEETDVCTGITWSLARAVNQQDSPGLKTFQSLNTFTISDDQGEIKRAWDATTSKGDNLYAVANRGVCLLLTKKSILTDLSGNDLGVFKGNEFIQEELWLDKNIGCNDEFWRGSTEASIASKLKDGSILRREALFFPNDTSVFMLMENSIADIGKDDFYSTLQRVLAAVGTGYSSRLTSFYDHKHDFYGLQVDHGIVNYLNKPATEDVFVYSAINRQWIGTYDYLFDQYLERGSELFGVRNGETYTLDEGPIINAAPIIYSIDQAIAPAIGMEKEFIRQDINSNRKPTRVEYYDRDMVLQAALDPGIQGPLYLKDYGAFRGYIPRKDLAVSTNRNRIQDRLLITRIIDNSGNDFKLVNLTTQYKILK